MLSARPDSPWKIVPVLLLAIGSLALAACGDESESADVASVDGPSACDPTSGGSIVIGLNEDLPTFDPSKNPVIGPTAFTLTPLVFDRLLRTSSDLKSLEPQLADSVEANGDFTEWTIQLRDDVVFQDGSELDSEDVAFSLQYNLDGFNGYALGPVSKITAIDPLSVRVLMDAPYAQFETQGLASWLSGFVYPADFNGQSAAEFFENPIGTGPYSVASFRPGQGVDLEANQDYWAEEGPYIDTIEARFVPESSERLLGLESGEFAFIDRLAGDQVDNLPSGSIPRVISPSASVDVLNLSSDVQLFDDPKVREAVSLALNREDIAAGAYAGYAEAAESTLPLALPNVSPLEDNPYVHDPDRASQLMADSSFPDGGKVEMTYIRGDANTELEAQLIQENLAEIGIDVSFESVGATEYFDLAVEGTRQFTLFNNTAVSPDPIDFLGFYADTGGYYGNWPTDEVVSIIEKLNRTDDPGAQQGLYDQFAEYIATENTQIPVTAPNFLNAQSETLSGLDIDPLNEARFGGAWVCSE